MATTIAENTVIIGGVDTHQGLHSAAAVSLDGTVLGTESFSTTRAGYRAMLRWFRPELRRAVPRIPSNSGSTISGPVASSRFHGLRGRPRGREDSGRCPALRLHVFDDPAGSACGWHPVLHRRVLGREAECIPSYELEDIAPAHAVIPADHVADGASADVPHVRLPARIRKHRQAVELVAREFLPDLKRAVLVPESLRLPFYRLGEAAFVHGFRRGFDARA